MGNKHSLNGRISNDNNNNGDVDAEQQPRSVGDLDTRQKWALFKGTYASLCVFVMSIICVFLYKSFSFLPKTGECERLCFAIVFHLH